MKDNIITVGSLVRVNGIKLIIIGACTAKDQSNYKLAYYSVPLPYGFMNQDSIKVVFADEVELLDRGYTSEHSDIYSTYFDMLDQITKKADADVIDKCMNSIKGE